MSNDTELGVNDGLVDKIIVDICAATKERDKIRHSNDPETIAYRLNKRVEDGQLWLAGDTANGSDFVFIDAVLKDERFVRVIPMSGYVAGYDSRDLVVFAKACPTGESMIAYPEFGTIIPTRTLWKPYGSFDADTALTIRTYRGSYDGTDLDMDPLVVRERIRRSVSRWFYVRNQLPEIKEDETKNHTQEEIVACFQTLGSIRGADGGAKYTPEQILAFIKGDISIDESDREYLLRHGVAEGLANRGIYIPKDLLVEVEQPLWREASDYLEETKHVKDGRWELAKRAKASGLSLAARNAGDGRERWQKALRMNVRSLQKES